MGPTVKRIQDPLAVPRLESRLYILQKRESGREGFVKLVKPECKVKTTNKKLRRYCLSFGKNRMQMALISPIRTLWASVRASKRECRKLKMRESKFPSPRSGVFPTIMGQQPRDRANSSQFEHSGKGHFGAFVTALWTSSTKFQNTTRPRFTTFELQNSKSYIYRLR